MSWLTGAFKIDITVAWRIAIGIWKIGMDSNGDLWRSMHGVSHDGHLESSFMGGATVASGFLRYPIFAPKSMTSRRSLTALTLVSASRQSVAILA